MGWLWLKYSSSVFTHWSNTFNYLIITIQLQYNMTFVFNHINCLSNVVESRQDKWHKAVAAVLNNLQTKQTNFLSSKLHQYSHKTLFGTCTMLCNSGKLASCKLNQLCWDSDKSLCLNCSVISYDHYTVSASSICIPNTTRELEQFFICWCCCCLWWWQQLFLICIMLSSFKKIQAGGFTQYMP